MSYLVEKNPVQSTSIKVQGSISYTPEGTNPAGVRLIGDVEATSIEALKARGRSIGLRRRPIVSSVKTVPMSSTNISWIVKLSSSTS
jgi:hypothetical protein